MKEKRPDTAASENANNMSGAVCAIETTAPASVGSFETYCREHYTRDITEYLTDMLNKRMLSVGRRSLNVPEPQRFTITEASINSMRFHESDPHSVYAELVVDATIRLSASYGYLEYSDTVIQKYKVDAGIVFLGKTEAEIRCFNAEIFDRWGVFERDYTLNEYLLPVFDKDQLDTVAEELLAKYYPEVLNSPEKLDGEELARRMGLTVIYACISKSGSELGRIYIDPCDVTTYDSDGNSVTVHLDGGTIVIDPLAARKSSGGRVRLNIFHECVHYEYHPLFYRAQVLMGGSIDCLSNSTDTLFPKDSPVGIAERQANQIAPRIAMPIRHAVRKANALVDKNQERHPNWNSLRIMEKVIDEMSEFYCVSRQCAKIRLIEFGYREAEGVFDYSNGSYVPSYQVTAGNCAPTNRTYTISFADMVREYNENAAFRKVVDSGKFLYVESHLCRISGRYIRRSKAKGRQLTTYARGHINECCIAFAIRGSQAEYNYCPGMLKKGAPQAAKIISYPGRCEAEKKAEQEDIPAATARLLGVLKELPATFDETLKYHMDSRHITIENLEELSLVSASTIKRLRPKQNEDEEEPTVTLPTVIALCIGLNLEPMLSEDLVAKAGYSFRNTKTDTAYRLVLYHMYFYSIYQCNEALVASGVKPLTKAS